MAVEQQPRLKARDTFTAQARTTARLDSDKIDVRGLLREDEKPEPKGKTSKSTPVDASTLLPEFTYEVSAEKVIDEQLKLSVILHNELGTIRPRISNIATVLAQIGKRSTTVCDFFLDRGRFSVSPWITVATKADGVSVRQLEKHQTELDYEVCSSVRVGTRLTIRVMLYPASRLLPTQDEIEEIAAAMVPETGYSVKFYLPGMDIDGLEWASVSASRPVNPPRTAIYGSRASVNF